MALPLAFELAAVTFLADSSRRAEEEAKLAEHMRDISDTTNALVKDLYIVMGGINLKELEQTGDYSGLAANEELSISQEMNHLLQITEANPEQHRIVLDSHRAFEEAVAALHDFSEALKVQDKAKCTKIRKGMKYFVRRMIPQELIDLPGQAKGRQGEARERELGYRSQVRSTLIALVLGSILLFLLLAVLVTKNVTRRLARLSDNALRVARNEDLPPALSGSDEIADVDRAFHAMVLALEESIHRERAVLQNARDVICSIDQSGRISAMNQAALSVLGYESDDLLGRYYIDLVDKADAVHVLKSIEEASKAGHAHQFEARLVKKNGLPIDLLWSTGFVEREQTLFCVLHDITERKEAERLRQEVVAMVTHDLRTPLTAIRHIIEMMRSGMAGEVSPDGAQMLGRADVASTRMMLLINDLLDIEKIKSGMMQLKRSRVMASELFELCSQTVSGLLAEKSITLSIADGDTVLVADADRIAQVLVNLVSNAIKFSKPAERIELSACNRDGVVELSVRDYGRGIPAHMLHSIFERFQQVQDADARKLGGSGLGLAICQAIVELHGGKIWAESIEGQGSTFKFTIPAQS